MIFILNKLYPQTLNLPFIDNFWYFYIFKKHHLVMILKDFVYCTHFRLPLVLYAFFSH